MYLSLKVIDKGTDYDMTKYQKIREKNKDALDVGKKNFVKYPFGVLKKEYEW